MTTVQFPSWIPVKPTSIQNWIEDQIQLGNFQVENDISGVWIHDNKNGLRTSNSCHCDNLPDAIKSYAIRLIKSLGSDWYLYQ